MEPVLEVGGCGGVWMGAGDGYCCWRWGVWEAGTGATRLVLAAPAGSLDPEPRGGVPAPAVAS